jgi:hypothetical protein
VEHVAIGNTFDRRDRGAIGLHRQRSMQLFTLPSMGTLHAPHWLVSQPIWVPVLESSQRIDNGSPAPYVSVWPFR